MSFLRLLGRRHSRLAILAVAAVSLLLLLPTARHELGSALWFVFFSPSLPSLYSSSASLGNVDVIQYINPLIGTVNGGHVFPGASLPYGMAKAVADTDSRAENAAGFVSDDSKIIGFSHMHDSGTGGSPSLGNFPLFVHPGCPDDDYEKCAYMSIQRGVARRDGTARASPGYFAIDLNNSVSAEMTASQHAALYRFTFDLTNLVDHEGQNDDGGKKRIWSAKEYVPFSPLVVLDLADLANSRSMGNVEVFPDTGRVTGSAAYAPSFGSGRYEAYVCADFDGAVIRNTGVFAATTATDEQNSFDFTKTEKTSKIHRTHGSAGAWLQFAPPSASEEKDYSIDVRVGVSFISTDQACANAEREIPDTSHGKGWDFDGTVLAAQDAWREKLAPIQVDAAGVSVDMQTTFWSGLYRALLSPQNYTGENQKWTSDEPYYDSFYCIWDSFRAQHPLLTILDPPAQTEMVRALLDIYRHDGKLPDCRMSFCKGYTQGGSNADVVIADAFVKNLTGGGIDWATAYEAVVSDAEIEPRVWGVEGRGNLDSYHALGYIPWDDQDSKGSGPMSRSISRLVEYAYDDFSIALMAKGLRENPSLLSSSEGTLAYLDDDYAKYHARGANWKNLWNPDQHDLYRGLQNEVAESDFVGFLQPRLLNGSFMYHSTRRCSPVFDMHSCYYDTRFDTYEGSPWLYSFYAPQDMRALVQLMGGRDIFAKRLHYFHESGIAYMGNEQTFLPVYQFHYAGRPGLSSYWAHEYVPGLFNASVNGIPGNDDCAMGAFSAFVYMGFFPVAGQNVYLLTPPFFREVRIRARDNKADAVLRVVNFDPTYRNKYIQNATLNGEPYTRNWITHDIFLHGGVLEFTVGPEESKTWGTREEDLPPSYYGE
ncbi:glycoside hydrolase family 92 protein [Ophiostoma piceae UAMH 11346]|uniref:Glycoside hydrolase family 92 protein n=1 Tax=Ophiostoma piceae (strain UAMH 11346) TaxID=1262450 RepID=S3BSV4_OPHP1|nr:glycoside hydrolase family 92 protein [Ophiostoma piceae UAMH 11346]